MIYKALNRNILSSPEGLRYLYTNQVHENDLQDLSGVCATAHLFQRLVPKRLELRIIIIGATLFAAEIYSQHAEKSKIDFRKSYDDLRYGIHDLPLSIQKQLLKLMHLLHLEYAAIDMILQPDGQYVFLELNCSGQFGWIEDETKMPISKTLATLLLQESPRVADATEETEVQG